MMRNIILYVIFMFCLSINIPSYAQWGLFGKNPIDLVKDELQKGVDSDNYDMNDPSKWVVSSQKGDISIIGWKSRKAEKNGADLVSYTFKHSNDTAEKGWWWEVNTKEDIVRIVLQDTELSKKYSLGDPNKVIIKLLKGMSRFTVKTLYGEPKENNDDPQISYWSYNINTQDNQHLSLKIEIVNDEVFDWTYINLGQQSNGKPLNSISLDQGKRSQQTFSIGSTQDDVRRVEGTPSSISDNMWSYGQDVVSFNSNGRVTGYLNNSGQLKVR
jgi:hypothetical protein